MRICFFANLSAHENWREMFDKVEFYRVDIRLLRELGHEVVLAGRPSAIDRSADLYYTWWWGHSPYTLLAGLLRRRPVVVTGAFDYATCRTELPGMCFLDRPLWQRMVLQTALRLADRNLFISRYEHDEVTRHLPVRNPVCAPLAIDTDYYEPDSQIESTGDYFFAVSWTSHTNVIRKGVLQGLDAFARVSADFDHVRFVLAGKPGDYHAALQEHVRRLGIERRVEFLGMISDDEKRTHYQRCIAYVQPTRYEGFGHAIGEALSCGAPIVSAGRGAVPEVVGEHGRLVDPDDVGAIAAAMREYLLLPRTPTLVRQRHAWIAEHYSLDCRRRILAEVIGSLPVRAARTQESRNE